MTFDQIESAAYAFGLVPLGVAREGAQSIVLLGPDEPRFWPLFERSVEYQDAQADPIDRYSTRVITALADELHAVAKFPFGGPPYEPFYTWAINSGQFHTSPIHFLVHRDRGLFASFRGALVFDTALKGPIDEASPCVTCDAPCLTACPVGAFTPDGYVVEACKTHLREQDLAKCLDQGCAARRACPVGQGRRLPEQAAHHMTYFLG